MEDILIGNGIRVNGRDYEIIGATGGDSYSAGGPSVFDVFDTVPYDYLEINRGSARGDEIVGIHSATGIFKLRADKQREQTSEHNVGRATLHMKPNETFLSDVPTNREHYRLTLNPANFVDGTS